VARWTVDGAQPSALSLQPPTLNPQPSTLIHQPSTLNPQPSTLNPQPSTLNPYRCEGGGVECVGVFWPTAECVGYVTLPLLSVLHHIRPEIQLREAS